MRHKENEEKKRHKILGYKKEKLQKIAVKMHGIQMERSMRKQTRQTTATESLEASFLKSNHQNANNKVGVIKDPKLKQLMSKLEARRSARLQKSGEEKYLKPKIIEEVAQVGPWDLLYEEEQVQVAN